MSIGRAGPTKPISGDGDFSLSLEGVLPTMSNYVAAIHYVQQSTIIVEGKVREAVEEAVERMQKKNAERAAREAQRSSRGDGAEIDSNDDAEQPGRVHGGLENQGGAERTESETTDRLRSLGAWVVAPLQRVRPLLGALNRAMIRVLLDDAPG